MGIRRPDKGVALALREGICMESALRAAGRRGRPVRPKTREITPRQREVYDFIVGFIRGHQMPPTAREIAAALGMRSPHAVSCHLVALEVKGYITTDGGNRARSIRLAGHFPCPCCGGLGTVPAAGPEPA